AKPGQISASFSVAGTNQDSARLSTQAINVSRFNQIGRRAARINNNLDGTAPVERAGAAGDPSFGIEFDGKCCPGARSINGGLQVESQAIAKRPRHRQAKDAASLREHEVD